MVYNRKHFRCVGGVRLDPWYRWFIIENTVDASTGEDGGPGRDGL